MSDTIGASDAEDIDERRRGMIELLAAVLLGVAGILTAYAAYNSALTDGDALKGYTESAGSTADANFFYNKANQTYSSDQATFLQYQVKVEEGADEIAGVIRDTLFTPELEAATAAWEATPAGEGAASPLDMDEYVSADLDEAESLTTTAAQQFDEAQRADDAGDKFELAAVFLALALFAAGIASLFRRHNLRLALLVGSVVLIVPGVISILQGRSGS